MTVVVHPSRERPDLAMLGIALVAVSGWAIAVSLGTALGAVAGIAGLVVATRRFWFASTVHADAAGLRVVFAGRSARWAWTELVGLRVVGNGVVLQLAGAPSRFVVLGAKSAEVGARLRAHWLAAQPSGVRHG